MVFSLLILRTWQATYQRIIRKARPSVYSSRITFENLMAARAENNQFKYHTTDGSHAFKVAVFALSSYFCKVAPYLCISKECRTDYGSSMLFQVYYYHFQKLNKILLSSEMLPEIFVWRSYKGQRWQKYFRVFTNRYNLHHPSWWELTWNSFLS